MQSMCDVCMDYACRKLPVLSLEAGNNSTNDEYLTSTARQSIDKDDDSICSITTSRWTWWTSSEEFLNSTAYETNDDFVWSLDNDDNDENDPVNPVDSSTGVINEPDESFGNPDAKTVDRDTQCDLDASDILIS